MNSVQYALFRYLRRSPILADHLAPLSDHQITHLMFSGRGLRLTQFGVQIMQQHFISCRIDVPDEELSLPAHLLHLEAAARMPYYVGADHLIVYDPVQAMRLKIVEGRISILCQSE